MAELDLRRRMFRRLTLIGPVGDPFLERVGIDVRLFGLFAHRILGPDPGLDLHDHPWEFVTVVVRGGYNELFASARTPERARHRRWARWTVHRFRQTDAHRITTVEPGTLTLVFRGPKNRRWGFYPPAGFVDYEAYDYEARRPVMEVRA